MSKMFCTTVALWIVLAAGGLAETPQSAVYKVIVNEENPTAALTQAEISDLLLKKQVFWDHSAPVVPVDLPYDSPVRDAFSRDIHGRLANAVRSSWLRQMMAGGEAPPLEAADDAEVIGLVKGEPGGIGYVSRSTPLAGVKEVRIIWIPKRTRVVRPAYSRLGLKAGKQGDVVLQVTVDTEGQVIDIVMLQDLGYGLGREAMSAVRQWRFEPTKVDGEPVEVTFELTVKFRL